MDTTGPITPASYRDSYSHIVTMIEDTTRFSLAYLLYNKCKMYLAFTEYIKTMRRLIRDPTAKILAIRMVKFNTDMMHEILQWDKIESISCNPGTSQHNSVEKG